MLTKEELNELEARIADLELAIKVLEESGVDGNDCSFDEAFEILNSKIKILKYTK